MSDLLWSHETQVVLTIFCTLMRVCGWLSSRRRSVWSFNNLIESFRFFWEVIFLLFFIVPFFYTTVCIYCRVMFWAQSWYFTIYFLVLEQLKEGEECAELDNESQHHKMIRYMCTWTRFRICTRGIAEFFHHSTKIKTETRVREPSHLTVITIDLF